MALDKKDENEDSTKNFLERFCGMRFAKNCRGLFIWQKVWHDNAVSSNSSDYDYDTISGAVAEAWEYEAWQAVRYHEIPVSTFHEAGEGLPQGWLRLSSDEQENLIKESTFAPPFATKSDPTGGNPPRDEADEHILDDNEDEGARPTPMARSHRMGCC